MRTGSRVIPWAVLLVVVAIAFPTLVEAAVRPEKKPAVAELEFRHPGLDIDTLNVPAGSLAGGMRDAALSDLRALGLGNDQARMDRRTGRWSLLVPSRPIIPGDGKGNSLGWAKAPGSDSELRAAAFAAFHDFLGANAARLRIDPSELAHPGRMTVHKGGDLLQIWIPRVIGGVPIRDSYLTASIGHGNLILFGAHNWGDVNAPAQARLSEAAAVGRALDHVAGIGAAGMWRRPTLTFVPMANGPVLQNEVGRGLDYRLAWVVRPTLNDDQGRWEALIDASSGELLAFQDTNHYATPREVVGGIYPISNDGMDPDGIEQLGYPMPFDHVQTEMGEVTTDSGGNLPFPVDGRITSNLSGEFIHMNDFCGSISLRSTGDIDFGGSGGDDCVTPGFGDAGNTHSSRTGFYELNRIAELARGQLPENLWLTQTLTANMNINGSCGAFWNGSVNFYRSGGGCGNTGELAGVFDHEWGHGMDANDTNPGISSPGEGIPDVYAALRLGTSCVGRGFFGGNCNGYGDPCIDCTGVRDIDWAMRASGLPHDYTWSNANCGGISHCQGTVYAESAWDIWRRDLPARYGMDDNTAWEVTQQLTYIGAGNVGTWFTGGPPFGGCSATTGYQNYIAADDDNGDLNDGTPHMQAIFGAYDRHEIACLTPKLQDSGCDGTPTMAPTVTAAPLNTSVSLDWDPVPGAIEYGVYRTDGVFECEFSKVRAGVTAATSFIDEGLLNDHDYSYVVVPMGPSGVCFGPASPCTTIAPAEGPNVGIDPDTAELVIHTGDGDDFFDNCEMATMSVDVSNTGLGDLTNVRIGNVTSPSHPEITIDAVFPVLVVPPDLSEGQTGVGSFDLTGGGMMRGDTVILEVSFTADELGVDKTDNLMIFGAESDFTHHASLTYEFEADSEDWMVTVGTFERSDVGGGANGTDWYQQSSDNLPDACDQIRSPVLSLNPDSTLSLWNRYDIEPEFAPGVWYDRANIGIYEVLSGDRTTIDPDGGRLYEASGSNGSCFTQGENGWAGVNDSWGESTWSSAALGASDLAGELVQLDVVYGTDPIVQGFGFRFDGVTLTEVDIGGTDKQSDVCEAGDFTLDISGTCPGGPVDILTTGGTGLGVVLTGDGPGTDPIPNGPCIGMPSGLSNPRFLKSRDLNIDVTVFPADGACGLSVQILEFDTCTLTNVDQVP